MVKMLMVSVVCPVCLAGGVEADDRGAFLEISGGALRDKNGYELNTAAIIAICIELTDTLKQTHPVEWARAIEALEKHSKVVQALFYHSPVPLGDGLRAKALAAGVANPAKREDIW